MSNTIDRRTLLAGSVMGSVLGALAGDSAAEANPGQDDRADRGIARVSEAIAEIRDELRQERLFTEIRGVREAQVTFLRANAKFPDYIDVGIDAWFAVHDWHIRWQQPLAIGRDPQGRHTILLNETAIVMRIDAAPTFIGLPYDSR
jgi:hypothetical protein